MSAAPKIYAVIPQASKEIGAIGKNGTNTQQNYKFRKMDDIYNKIQPVLSNLGICFIPQVLESKEDIFENGNGKRAIRVKVRVKYSIYADDGSMIETIVEGESIDSSDKATNKALTAAFKYMLIQVFCIAIEEHDDADAHSPEIGTNRKVAPQPVDPAVRLARALSPVPEPEPEKVSGDPGEYLINFGKYKNRRLKNIDIFELDGYVKWLAHNAGKGGNGHGVSRLTLEVIAQGEAYLKSREFNRDGGELK